MTIGTVVHATISVLKARTRYCGTPAVCGLLVQHSGSIGEELV